MLASMEGAGDDDGQATGFAVPCVMLMLQDGPREAHELRELVAAFGFRQQAAEMDSTLQRLEDERLIDTVDAPIDGGERGPCYELSGAGRRWLADRSPTLAEPARLLARFLDRYTTSAVATSAGGNVGLHTDTHDGAMD